LEGSNFRKNLSILGSTGSIGTQTLDIVRAKPENFRVTSLSAGRNLELLVEQIKEFQPEIVSVQSKDDIKTLKVREGWSEGLERRVGPMGWSEATAKP